MTEAAASPNGSPGTTRVSIASGPLVGLRLHAPRAGRTVTTVLAVSAGNDLLQAGFAWLTARANTAAADADVESELSSATRRAA